MSTELEEVVFGILERKETEFWVAEQRLSNKTHSSIPEVRAVLRSLHDQGKVIWRFPWGEKIYWRIDNEET